MSVGIIFMAAGPDFVVIELSGQLLVQRSEVETAQRVIHSSDRRMSVIPTALSANLTEPQLVSLREAMDRAKAFLQREQKS